MLAQLSTWLGKTLGRVEGGRITGPLAPVSLPESGYIPMSWPWNFWQLGYNVLPNQSCSIVDACVWAYVRAIAQLPGYHKREGEDGGFDIVTTTALSRILRFPNSYQTESDFLTHGIRSLLYEGNWYSLAVRNQRNEIIELHPLDPRATRVTSVAVAGQFEHEIFYSVGGNPLLNFEALIDDERVTIIPARDVLHVKLMASQSNPLMGESWLTNLASDMAGRHAIQGSMTSFFQNASRPSGIIKTPGTLTPAQVDKLKAKWYDTTRGVNAGGIAVLQQGYEWINGAAVTQKDADAVEALKLSDKQICGMFGVPGILVGVDDGKPFASTEALMSYWLANGLGWMLNHIETQMDQFFGLGSGWEEWTEYDTEALLRSDLKTRIEALARGTISGIYSPNEARAKEGFAAVEAGDEPRVQQQVVPLSFALEPPAPPAAVAVPPAAPAAGDEAEEEPEEDDEDTAKLYAMIARAKGLMAYEQARIEA